MEAGKLIEARSVLSAAYFSGTLTAPQEAKAREALTKLAEQTIFSPIVYEGDPYAISYMLNPGEVLDKVERKLELHVPTQLVLKINNISDASRIRAGQKIKMIQGPFHAIVDKSDFTLDIYLQREGLEKIFVKRFAIGLGKDGSTPTGMWHVAKGRKNLKPVYYPTADSPNHDKGPIAYGAPGYVFGTKGMWIGLEGLEASNKTLDNYGIHSTNHPESIGKAESEGCIRMVDDDIEWVFSLLYEVWSTVQIKP